MDNPTVTDPAELLRAALPVAIADLGPQLSDLPSKAVSGIVTITWPYNSVNAQLSFTLAEPDFRLRLRKGQIRVNLRGPAALALAQSGLGSSDNVTLSLQGAEWQPDNPISRRKSLPNSTQDWQLSFTHRLLLKLNSAETQETQVFAVDDARLSTPSEPLQTTQDIPDPESESPRHKSPLSQPLDHGHRSSPPINLPLATPAKNDRIRKLNDEFESPAFVKRARVSYGSLFEDGYDIFNDDDKQRPTNKRKSTRFARPSGAWRYSSHSPSPEPEEPLDENTLDANLDSTSSPVQLSQQREPPDAAALATATAVSPSPGHQPMQTLHASQATDIPPASPRPENMDSKDPPQPEVSLPPSFGSQSEAFGGISSSSLSTELYQGGSAHTTFDTSMSNTDMHAPWVPQSDVHIQEPGLTTGHSLDTPASAMVGHGGPAVFEARQVNIGGDYIGEDHSDFENGFANAPVESAEDSAYPSLDLIGNAPETFIARNRGTFSADLSLEPPTFSQPYPNPGGIPFAQQIGSVVPQSSSWNAVNAVEDAKLSPLPQDDRVGSAGHSSESPVVIDESESEDEQPSEEMEKRAPAELNPAERQHVAEDEDAENEEDAEYSEEEPEDASEAAGDDYDVRNYTAPDDDEDDSHDEDLRRHSLELEFANEEHSWDDEDEQELEDGDSLNEEQSDEEMESDDDQSSPQRPISAPQAASAASAVIDLISDSEDENEVETQAKIPNPTSVAPPSTDHSTQKRETRSGSEVASEVGDRMSVTNDDEEENSEEEEEDEESEEEEEGEEEEEEEEESGAEDEKDEEEDRDNAHGDRLPDEDRRSDDGSATGDKDSDDVHAKGHLDESNPVDDAEKVNSTSPRVDSTERNDAPEEPSNAGSDARDVSVLAAERLEVLTKPGSKDTPQDITVDVEAEARLSCSSPGHDEVENGHRLSPARIHGPDEHQDAPEIQPGSLRLQSSAAQMVASSPKLPLRPSPKQSRKGEKDLDIVGSEQVILEETGSSITNVDMQQDLAPRLDEDKVVTDEPPVLPEASPGRINSVPVDSSGEEQRDGPAPSRSSPLQGGEAAGVAASDSSVPPESTRPVSGFQTQLDDLTQTSSVSVAQATAPLMDEVESSPAKALDFGSSLRSLIETDEELQHSILEDSQYDMALSPTTPFSKAASLDEWQHSEDSMQPGFSPLLRQRLFEAIEAGWDMEDEESQRPDPSLELARAAQVSSQLIREIEQRAHYEDLSLELARAAQVSSQLAQEFKERQQENQLEHARAVQVSKQIAQEMEQRAQRAQQMDPSVLLARASNKPRHAKHASVGSDRRRSVGTTRSRASKSSKATTPEMYDTSLLLARGLSNLPAKPEEDGSSIAAAKLGLGRLLRDDLPDCTPLQVLSRHMNKTTDAIGVAMMQPADPQRAKGGPREYMMSFTVTDHSSAPNSVTEVQLYRPHKESLPTVKVGDVVLLRHFKAVALKDKGTGLRTTDESSWAVFDLVGEPAQVKGPPVEYGAKETAYVEALREWFNLLGSRALGKLEKANRNIIQAGNSGGQSP